MSSEIIFQHKERRVTGLGPATGVAGQYTSMWLYEGIPSDAPTPPSTFANPDNTTFGGLLQTNPAAGKQKWLTSLLVCSPNIEGACSLYDRLLHISGFSGISTAVQNVNGGSPATLSRHYTNVQGDTDIGNSMWLEVYTAIGATPTTATVTYANELGNTQTTTCTVNRTAVGTAMQIPLAPGDRGVSSVTSVQLAGSTGTAGNFGIIVAHKLVDFIVTLGEPKVFSGAQRGFVEILPNACLAWLMMQDQAQTNLPPLLEAQFSFADW